MSSQLNKSKYVILTVLLLLFAYVIYRAFNIGLTLDEGATFKILEGDKIVAATANNHFLNTWLIGFFRKIFGDSELSLRLPNIIGFIFYGLGCYRFLKDKKLFIVICGIALLLLNPYVIDFFSVARGYGLALGFFMFSFSYFINCFETNSVEDYLKNGSISLLLLIIACLANLTYVNINLIILLLLFLGGLKFIKHLPPLKKQTLPILALAINGIITLLLIKELLRLKEAKELYHGGTVGFIDDTVRELIFNSVFYYSHQYEYNYIYSIGYVFAVIFVSLLIYALAKRKFNKFSVTTIFLGLLVLAPIIQLHVLHTPLPYGRTSIYYSCIFGITLVLFFEQISTANQTAKKSKAWARILATFITIIWASNFFINVNTYYIYDWKYNYCTKEAIKLIEEKFHGQRVSIMYTTWYESVLRYYKHLWKLDNIIMSGENRLNTDEDVLLVMGKEKEPLKNLDEYDLIKYFDGADCYLFFKKDLNHPVKEIRRKFVNIIAYNNLYLLRNWDNVILAKSSKPNLWEGFYMIFYDDGKCAIKDFEGFYFCGDINPDSHLISNREQQGLWERFEFIDLKNNNQFALKGANGKYISVSADGHLYAKSDTLGETEKFKMCILQDEG